MLRCWPETRGTAGRVERMIPMRRIAGAVAVLVLAGTAPLVAQYFGQNKVQYRTFDFQIIQTEHFEVYYYPAERVAALDAARMAERWYARLSRVLHHEFQGRKPIILYASQSDFQQTNVVDASGEGLGGVTEFFKHRMVLPFTGSYAELEHVIGHEMVHQFQCDVFSRGRIGAGVQTLINVNPPLWFMEGMAEYLSLGPIDNHTAMWLRDASLEGHLPTIEQLTYDPRIFPYYFGHALWAYIGEKWSDEVIGEILQGSTASGVEGAFKRALGLSLDDLSSEWRDAVQTTYLPQLAEHYRARRIAQPVLTRKRSDGTLHIAPALSHDGRDIAYFSERKSFFVDLYLADAETGRVKRRLTKATLSNNYESLRFINSAGSFSPDGRYFAIAAKHNDKDDLVILDVKKDEEVRRITVPLNGLINPAWAPDGRSIAFVSDRTGISNIYLYDLGDHNLYQLTDLFTGAEAFTPLSPVLSWARQADRMAFAYYEEGEYNVYAVDNPRSLRRQPFQEPAVPPVTSLLAATRRDTVRSATPAAEVTSIEQPRAAASVYRSPTGFRASNTSPQKVDSGTTATPVSVRTLLDSATTLPDTSEFTFKAYHTRFTPDYVARPTIGYERNNFGRGFFGGTAISLSDMLGNHTLVFAGAVNGRLSEAQVLAAYINQAHRLNWAVGATQQPYYFYQPTTVENVAPDTSILTVGIRRFVIREGFVETYYPFSRFSRVELGVHAVNITDAVLQQQYLVDRNGIIFAQSDLQTISNPSISYVSPSLALVHDNSLFGYVGPFAGSRYRLQVNPNFGDWQFVGGLADWRRYFFARPFTFAFRGLFFGRFGRNGDEFPVFLGTTELLRGYTAGSLINNECANSTTTTTGRTGCSELDQLIGSRIAVAGAELRFPLTRNLVLGFLPVGLPPIEGAIFYDMGLAWESGSVIKWRRDAGQDPEVFRQPLRSWGGSIRVNFLGFVVVRFDYTKPLDRLSNKAYWTVSLGPTF